MLASFLVGTAFAASRAVYLSVVTSGFTEGDFTVHYGISWGTDLPLSVVYWFIFGFTSFGLFRGQMFHRKNM